MQLLRSRLAWVLLAIATILLLIAAGAAVGFVLLGQQEGGEDGWEDPIAAIQPDEVAPDLALYPLAGARELETVDAAIENDELETAYALLVFSQDLSDAQRLGRLIRLGGRFAEAERPDRATLCYQQVYDLAILHPRLSDPARADALFASGRGWAALGEEVLATRAFDQVYVLAMESPYLQMANRRDLLAGLATAYEDLGNEDRAEVCRVRIVELDQEARPQPPALPGEQPDLPMGTGTVSSAEVGTLERARREAALTLLEAITDGGAPPAELLEAVDGALLAEDAAKQALYSQELEATSQPGRQAEVHWQMIRWLMLKYQVAAGGFGLTLVPTWEAALPSIQSELSKAYEDLYFNYEDLVAALPQAGLIGPGSYQVRRQVLLDGRLGRYVNYPAAQLADKMQDAARELMAAGSAERLYVDVRSEEEKELEFFLSPTDEYGLSAETP